MKVPPFDISSTFYLKGDIDKEALLYNAFNKTGIIHIQLPLLSLYPLVCTENTKQKSTDDTCVRHGPKHEIHLAEYKGRPTPNAPLPQDFFFLSFFSTSRSHLECRDLKSHHHIEPLTGHSSTGGTTGHHAFHIAMPQRWQLALAHKNGFVCGNDYRAIAPAHKHWPETPFASDEQGNDKDVVYNKHQRLSGSWQV